MSTNNISKPDETFNENLNNKINLEKHNNLRSLQNIQIKNEENLFVEKEKIFKIQRINLKKNFWTLEEDQKLSGLVKKYGSKKWKRISKFFPDKTNVQCSARYRRLENGIKKKPWSKSEDESIINLVKQKGERWNTISKILAHRSPKKLRERYYSLINFNFNIDQFSLEEDKKIFDLYKNFGNKWTLISKYFNNRKKEELRKRYFYLIKKNSEKFKTFNINIESNIHDDLNLNFSNREMINLDIRNKPQIVKKLDCQNSDRNLSETLKIKNYLYSDKKKLDSLEKNFSQDFKNLNPETLFEKINFNNINLNHYDFSQENLSNHNQKRREFEKVFNTKINDPHYNNNCTSYNYKILKNKVPDNYLNINFERDLIKKDINIVQKKINSKINPFQEIENDLCSMNKIPIQMKQMNKNSKKINETSEKNTHFNSSNLRIGKNNENEFYSIMICLLYLNDVIKKIEDFKNFVYKNYKFS